MSKHLLAETPTRERTTGDSSLHRRHAGLAEIAILLPVTAAYLFPFTRLLHRIGDEGTIVYGAQRVFEGAVPYRDFQEVVGPGSFYWLALFFKLFGDSWQVSRLCLLLTAVAFLLLVYWIARQYLNRTAALLSWLFVLVFGIPLWPACNHHWDSNLFALCAAACFLEWQKQRNTVWLAATGALAGVTSCFIQQKGMYVLLAFVIVILIARPKLPGNHTALGLISVLLGPFIAVGGIVAILFYRAGALSDLTYCTFFWPVSGYSTVNAGVDWKSIAAAMGPASFYFRVFPLQIALLFQTLCFVPFLMLILLPVLTIAAGLIFARKSGLRTLLSGYRPALILPAIALWLSEMHRKDLYHLAYGSPLLVIALVQLLQTVPRNRVKSAILATTTITLFTLAASDLLNSRGGYAIQTRRGIIRDMTADDALLFLNDSIPRREQVFIYPYYPMYYYLADIRNPTRFSILMYNYNTRQQFKEVISDLETKHVKFVLWDTLVDGANLRTWFPGYIQPPADQLTLEHYLNARYELISMKNGFRILRRKQ